MTYKAESPNSWHQKKGVLITKGEEVRRSMEWVIKRLIKVGAKVTYHGRRWQVHIASAFPMARYYEVVLG